MLVQELSAAQQKWEDIGRELGVKQDTLTKIYTNYYDSGDCLRVMLSKWLERHCITWKGIIAILRTPRVGQFYLADQLEAKCYPSELYNYSGHNAVYTVSLKSNKALEIQMFSIAEQNAALKITF